MGRALYFQTMSHEPCVLCGKPATMRKVPDMNRYEYDCEHCDTKYAVGRVGMLLRRDAPESERTAHIAFVRRENKADKRPLI